MPVVIKLFQPPALRSVIEVLLEAVARSVPQRMCWFVGSTTENYAVDVALAMTHHACHQARRLKPFEAFLAYGGVQSTVGTVDGYCRGHGIVKDTKISLKSCGKEIHERPDAQMGMRSNPTVKRFTSVPLLSSTRRGQSSTEKAMGAFRCGHTVRASRCKPDRPALKLKSPNRGFRGGQRNQLVWLVSLKATIQACAADLHHFRPGPERSVQFVVCSMRPTRLIR